MFKNNMETKGHGSIRKTKAYGAVAVLSLLGVMAAANGQTVSANEIPTEGENITSEASDTSLAVQAAAVEAPVTEVAAEPVDEEPAVETTVAETPVVEAEPVAVETVAEAPVEEATSEPVITETPAVTEEVAVVTNADTTEVVETKELATAVSEAKAAGVKVVKGATVNLGTATTEAEAAALKAQAEQKEAEQAIAINAVTEDYLADVAEAQKNTSTEKWLKESVNQSLIYESEPNATATISNNVHFINSAGVTELKNLFSTTRGGNIHITEIGLNSSSKDILSNSDYYATTVPNKPYFTVPSGHEYYLTTFDANETVTVTQTGLSNSTFNGRKISKVEVDISIDKSASVNLGSDVIYLGYGNDFANGFEIGGYRADGTSDYKFKVNVAPRFYDENGELIDHSLAGNQALLGFSSLNYHTDHTEAISTSGGARVLEINGSSITNHNGIYRADKENTFNVYGEANIDSVNNPYFWTLGTGVVLDGKEPEISLIVATPSVYGEIQEGSYLNSIWFTLTSKLQAQGIVTNPTAEYNLYSYDVAIPDPVGFVVVEYKDEDGNTIKDPVTDTPESPVGTDYNTTDNKPNKITTNSGKTYSYKTVEGNETGKVVEGETKVTYIYSEVFGEVVVDYQDKNGNTISPREVDTPSTSTGTNYDTTDNKPVTIVTPAGKTYRIDTTATKGNETGKVVEGTTKVVYIYDEILGSVIVHYEDEDGNTIKSDVVDTPESSTNTPYDTGDNKPKTIVTEVSRTYELVPGLTRGDEIGRVVEGKTHVTYVYKELFGNVLVNYVDEEGNIIKAQVEDMPQTSTGVAYSTLDNKPNAIKFGDTIYNIIPGKTIGQETGKIVVGPTEVTYVYKVVEAEPVKVGTSDSGANVEGKVLLAGSTINYEVSIDNDQFKGIVGLTEEDLNTPLIVIEDFDDKTTPVTEAVRVVLASDKTKAQSGFTTTLYTSLAEAPKVIQDYIAANNISVNGEFSATVSDDAVAYNTNYVLTGTNLTLIFPAKINEDVKDASEIKNTAYQLDFSGAHVTNVVTNTTPDIDPQKDVTFTIEDGMADKNSLDGKEVAIGDVINFELKSSYYPANRVEPITELAFVDTWSDLVSYDGSYQFFATTDLLLKDGTTIVEGTDITKYVTQVINYEDRTVRYALDSDFLGAIALESPLQVAGYMQVTVEENGTVKNTFVEIVNGVENFSNTVTVEVPTPPVPEKPEEPAQPTPPTPETPVTPASVVPTLPNTGEETSSLAMAGMALLVGMGAAYGVSKRRRRSLK